MKRQDLIGVEEKATKIIPLMLSVFLFSFSIIQLINQVIEKALWNVLFWFFIFTFLMYLFTHAFFIVREKEELRLEHESEQLKSFLFEQFGYLVINEKRILGCRNLQVELTCENSQREIVKIEMYVVEEQYVIQQDGKCERFSIQKP